MENKKAAENKTTEEKYGDLYEREHPTSKRHPRMAREARAAQFAPFAALTGYESVLQEATRRTEEEVERAQGRVELPEETDQEIELPPEFGS